MPAAGSVSLWIGKLKEGEREAVQRLWEGYFRRLVGLVRAKLRSAPRQAADEEDVALSAFDSFCRAAEQGRFPRLEDRDDLWHLLVLIASRKAANQAKREGRQKRGGGKVVHASALPGGAAEGEGPLFADLLGREPDPALAAQVAEACRRLLDGLGDAELRTVALAKLEGRTNDEIAAMLGRTTGTVERKLGLIRRIWDREAGREDPDSR
jgi:DNA-directed RNA polymerase specialized sigma24 family protein